MINFILTAGPRQPRSKTCSSMVGMHSCLHDQNLMKKIERQDLHMSILHKVSLYYLIISFGVLSWQKFKVYKDYRYMCLLSEKKKKAFKLYP